MNNIYREAFAEVLEVIKHSNKNIKSKIPQKFITFLKNNKDKNYNVNINFYDKTWENTVKSETRAILALIYRDYIVSTEERKKLILEEKEENLKIEAELREKYNPNNVFKKNNSIQKNYQQNINNYTNSIPCEYEKSLFTKIKNLIFKMLHINK